MRALPAARVNQEPRRRGVAKIYSSMDRNEVFRVKEVQECTIDHPNTGYKERT